MLLFRDYGLYDMTQVRFISKKGRKLAENYYARADGTRTFFFSMERVAELALGAGFEIAVNKYDTRELRNRKRQVRTTSAVLSCDNCADFDVPRLCAGHLPKAGSKQSPDACHAHRTCSAAATASRGCRCACTRGRLRTDGAGARERKTAERAPTTRATQVSYDCPASAR